MIGRLKVDDIHRQLIMDKKFDMARCVVDSQEYNILERAKRDHPTYNVVRRHINKNPEKQIYKNMSYAYMREYIRKHPHAEERMAEFEEMTLRARCHITSYGRVKKWFLEAYPDISDFTPAQFQEEQESQNPVVTNFEIIQEARCVDNNIPLAS